MSDTDGPGAAEENLKAGKFRLRGRSPNKTTKGKKKSIKSGARTSTSRGRSKNRGNSTKRNKGNSRNSLRSASLIRRPNAGRQLTAGEEDESREMKLLEQRTTFIFNRLAKVFGFHVNQEAAEKHSKQSKRESLKRFGMTLDLSPRNSAASMDEISKASDSVRGVCVANSRKAKISPEVAKNILKPTLKVKVLNLAGVTFKGNSLDALLYSLESNTTVQSLSLARCKLGDVGCKKFCDTLLSTATSGLKDLNLSQNSLSTESATCIADVLMNSLAVNLEILQLNNNKLQTSGAITLLTAVQESPSLLVLHLESNQIFSQVAPAMHDVILKNNTLQIVSLRANSIDDLGAAKMLNSIRVKKIKLSTEHFKEHPDDLQKFTVHDFEGETKAQIAESIDMVTRQFNKHTLFRLDLTRNDVRENTLEDLDYVLRSRLMTVFRFKDNKTFWSKEAWTIADTEFGPKFIKDSFDGLTENHKKNLKYVVKTRNRQNQQMVEVLLRNKHVNDEIYQAVKALVTISQMDLDEKDSLGRPFREIMRQHENGAIRNWSRQFGAIDGRFMLQKGPPVHISRSSEILLATDTTNDKSVVIKIFKEKKSFDREVGFRKKLVKLSTKPREISNMTMNTTAAFSRNRKNFGDISSRRNHQRQTEDPSVKYLVKMIDVSKPNSKYNYVVYEHNDRSLFDVMNTEMIAGIDVLKIKKIATQAAENLQFINKNGFCHGDFKPRSLIRSSFDSEEYLLIDFDSSVKHGQPFEGSLSTAYIPPEVAKAKFLYQKQALSELTHDEICAIDVTASEKFDVWSFGVVLYELLSGSTLFDSLTVTGDLATSEAKANLINWLEIMPDKLHRILEQVEDKISAKESAQARELVRWCLQLDPNARPSFTQIISHGFLNAFSSTSQLVSLPKSFRTHLFLSHIQSQASGTVKDVFYCAKELGCSAWLDMKAGAITQQAMYEGVRMSEAFIVCLTRDTFFSFFCLKELLWALDHGKKLIFLVEVDKRKLMSPFDIQQFSDTFSDPEELKRLSNGLGSLKGLKLGDNLKQLVKQNKQKIKTEYNNNPVLFLLKSVVFERVQQVYNSGDCIPYRRREYENRAMMDYLLKRIGFHPPSDPLFDQFEEPIEPLGKISGIALKMRLVERRKEENRRRRQERHQHRMNSRRKKQTSGDKPTLRIENHISGKNVRSYEGTVRSADDDVIREGGVIVLVGEGAAKEMVEKLRQGMKEFLEMDDFEARWWEFGPDEKLTQESMKNLIEKNKFKNVAVLAVVTSGFFSETHHGHNLLVMEEALKEHSKKQQKLAKEAKEEQIRKNQTELRRDRRQRTPKEVEGLTSVERQLIEEEEEEDDQAEVEELDVTESDDALRIAKKKSEFDFGEVEDDEGGGEHYQFPVIMVQQGWFGRDWSVVQEEVGEAYAHYLLDVEFMPYRNHPDRAYEHKAMLEEISDRITEFCH